MSTGPCLFVGQELGKPLSDPDFRGCFVDLSKALGLRYWLVEHPGRHWGTLGVGWSTQVGIGAPW
jgi:hypothetical protein